MANAFSKEERVAFEDILEGFQDALVLSRNVAVYNTDSTMMERTDNVLWRPQPYISQSISAAPGVDISAQYKNYTQLAVPATLSNCAMRCKKVDWAIPPSRSLLPTLTLRS
jgi:hypothetical protein